MGWSCSAVAGDVIMKKVPGSDGPNGSFSASKAGSFRINGDGTFGRGPAFLKEFCK